MKSQRKIQQISKLADLILDKHLAELRKCAQACEESRERLRDLSSATTNEIVTIAEAQAALRYQQWADARRAEINISLARQTAEWLEARSLAGTAFGRSDVLQKLAMKPIS